MASVTNSAARMLSASANSPAIRPRRSRTTPDMAKATTRGIGTRNSVIPPRAAVDALGLKRSQKPTQQLVVSKSAYSSRT